MIIVRFAKLNMRSQKDASVKVKWYLIIVSFSKSALAELALVSPS